MRRRHLLIIGLALAIAVVPVSLALAALADSHVKASNNSESFVLDLELTSANVYRYVGAATASFRNGTPAVGLPLTLSVSCGSVYPLPWGHLVGSSFTQNTDADGAVPFCLELPEEADVTFTIEVLRSAYSYTAHLAAAPERLGLFQSLDAPGWYGAWTEDGQRLITCAEMPWGRYDYPVDTLHVWNANTWELVGWSVMGQLAADGTTYHCPPRTEPSHMSLDHDDTRYYGYLLDQASSPTERTTGNAHPPSSVEAWALDTHGVFLVSGDAVSDVFTNGSAEYWNVSWSPVTEKTHPTHALVASYTHKPGKLDIWAADDPSTILYSISVNGPRSDQSFVEWSPDGNCLAFTLDSDTVGIVIAGDVTPPTIGAISHHDGQHVESCRIALTGKVRDDWRVDEALLTVNSGTPTPLLVDPATQLFSETVPLVSGTNTISISAADMNGNTGSTSVQIVCPTADDRSIETLLGGIMDSVLSVHTFDGHTQSWQVYQPNDAASDLESLPVGQGCWIKVQTDCAIPYGSHTYRFHRGWNLFALLPP